MLVQEEVVVLGLAVEVVQVVLLILLLLRINLLLIVRLILYKLVVEDKEDGQILVSKGIFQQTLKHLEIKLVKMVVIVR